MSTNNLFERREYLLDKLRKKTLDTNEISELQQILENERNRGINIGDVAIVMGALIILGLIADYTSKKKFNETIHRAQASPTLRRQSQITIFHHFFPKNFKTFAKLFFVNFFFLN